jgi:hypothetical protein
MAAFCVRPVAGPCVENPAQKTQFIADRYSIYSTVKFFLKIVVYCTVFKFRVFNKSKKSDQIL